MTSPFTQPSTVCSSCGYDYVRGAIEFMDQHPWLPHIRFHKRSTPSAVIIAAYELVYTRWLRIRWDRKPIIKHTCSVRAWFGPLEIVLDPISKDRWHKRERNVRLRNLAGTRWALLRREFIPDVSHPHRTYLDRLRIVETPLFGIFLHRIYTPDGDDVMHDHPWSFMRIILRGGYREQWGYLNIGGQLCISAMRNVKRVSTFRSTDLHRIVKLQRTPTVTLVLHGPRHKDWGFVSKTTGRWTQWQRYLGGER